MEQQLKERLVGAVVILSILIIFLPMLFKQDKASLDLELSTSKQDASEIPASLDSLEKDSQNTVELEKQLKALEREQTALVETASPAPAPVAPMVVAAPTTAAPAPAAYVAPAEPLHVNASDANAKWVLRMGIFGNPKNAKILVENLQSKGYQAYTKVDSSKGAQITRVFVGPQMTKAETKKIGAKIKDEFKVQGIAVLAEQSGLAEKRVN